MNGYVGFLSVKLTVEGKGILEGETHPFAPWFSRHYCGFPVQ